MIRPAPAIIERPQWYALRTRPRAEKRAGARLADAGVEVFTAVAGVERKWADRTRRVRMPLYPGYIFARVDEARFALPLAVPGVVDLVRMDGRPSPVRDEEIEAVRRLAGGVDVTGALPEPVDPLQTGLQVRVVEGPFSGMTGVLLELVGGVTGVAVRIEALRMARAVRLERSAVKPLEGVTA